jgi:ring-1,2-phenylacetyl-CoA epoxidase subunit PaaD
MTAGLDVEALVGAVPDPELPFLTIADLGILRGVAVEGGTVRVRLTPTYSGCPAMDTIREDVRKALQDNGFDDVVVETVLAPPWTTDWLSERGRATLAEHGIAPPGPVLVALGSRQAAIACPRCGSRETEELSRFGATACKALHRCRACREPFEHLKAH